MLPVVAVGYDTGQMQLSDVENASCLHSVTLSAAITATCWVSGAMLEGSGTEADDTTEDVFQDMSSHYLPRLPAFSKGWVFRLICHYTFVSVYCVFLRVGLQPSVSFC